MKIHSSSSIVFLLALAIFLPFNALMPITDPVESNYALTAKEMLVSGDWMSPRIYGQFWFDKPVMIYWLIALAYKTFGISDFAARLPSAVFGAATVALAFRFAKRLYSSFRAGILAAMVLATSLEFWLLSRMIITDAVLMFFSSAAMVCFYRGITEGGWRWQAAAYALAGLAVLTKGPIGIVMPGLIVFGFIVFSRRWELLRRLFLLPGLVVLLAVVSPWYVYMYKAHGSIFIETFLGLHNFLRATVSEHPKDNVFYYYLVLFPVSLLPWSGVALRALWQGLGKYRFFPSGFLAVWTIAILVFFTMMATKYPTYIYPTLFPTAVLCGGNLEHCQRQGKRKHWLWLSIPALLLFILLGVAGRQLVPKGDWLVLYGLTALTSLTILWLQFRGPVRKMPEVVAAAVLLTSLVLMGQGLLSYTDSRSAKEIVKALPPEGATVGLIGEYATSAVYYSGYTIPHLVGSEKELRAEGVWAGKYTMPTEMRDSFFARTKDMTEVYIIVSNVDLRTLKQQGWTKEFSPVAVYGKYSLYKRAAAQ